jgi:hypothetical protein
MEVPHARVQKRGRRVAASRGRRVGLRLEGIFPEIEFQLVASARFIEGNRHAALGS